MVIGGGPAGYVGALRAAQLGAKVTLIESGSLGGTCLNVGCIPTKALLASASVMQQIQSSAQFGIQATASGFDWTEIQKRKERVVRKSTAGVGLLLKARKAEVITGRAHLAGRDKVTVEHQGQVREITYGKLLLATGSVPALPIIPGIDLSGVIDSTGALGLDKVPANLLIIGGGVIGCEMAEVFSSFGSRVTMVEMMDQLIPGEDPEAAQLLQRSLSKRGVGMMLGSRVESLSPSGELLSAAVAGPDGGHQTIRAEKVLVAVGRQPAIAGLGLEEAGVAVEKGSIKVNSRMETSQPGIYAAGDCIGGWLLAHVASREAEVAAENILGHKAEMEYHAIPRCVYTHPEIASVGITHSQAGGDGIIAGKFPFSASGKAGCLGQLDGWVKLLADRGSHRLLGCVIAGPGATELIAEASLAVSRGLVLEDIARAVHAHPTLHESMLEAALAALGRPLHLP